MKSSNSLEKLVLVKAITLVLLTITLIFKTIKLLIQLMVDGVVTETGLSVQRHVAVGHRLAAEPAITQFLLKEVQNVWERIQKNRSATQILVQVLF